jgi:restriction system protein
MDRNPDTPWNPRVPTDISPVDFEKIVLDWLGSASAHKNQTITTEHLGVVTGEGGQYKIDVLVTFSALGGASFVVLVECKHQTRPIEREDVMVLESKLRDVNAQKAMIFSTSGFQSGAIEFASAKRIASITVVEGAWLFETKGFGIKPATPPPWVKFPKYRGISLLKTTTGISCHTLEATRLDAIEDWLN